MGKDDLKYYSSNYRPDEYAYMPLALLKEPWNQILDSRAVVIYTYLLKLCLYSEKNGWIDKNNRIYVKFSTIEMAKLLNVTRKTAATFKQQLVSAGLIEIPGEEKSQRSTHCYPIYVKVIPNKQNNILQMKNNTANKFNNIQKNNYDMQNLENILLDN